MSFWPPKAIDQLNFSQAHIGPWTTNAAAIGITAADVTAFQSLTDDAVAAYNAAQQAKLDAKAATQAMHQALDTLHKKASYVVTAVGAKAKATNNPGVYTLAALPIPGTGGGGTTNPSMPTDLRAFVENDGSVTLEWRGSKLDTAFFSVWRRLTAGGDFEQIGGTDEKSFNDSSIPNGSSFGVYYVRAHKGQKVSAASEPVQVIFGCGGLSVAA